MGDSLSPTDSLTFYRVRSVARIRGLENLLCFDPGACAPSFMLPPASQAKSHFLVHAHQRINSSTIHGNCFEVWSVGALYLLIWKHLETCLQFFFQELVHFGIEAM